MAQTGGAFSVEFDGSREIPSMQPDICAKCGEILQIHLQLSLLVCPQCGRASTFLEAMHGTATSIDDGCGASSVNNKRISHWLDYLKVLKTSSVDIPEEVIKAVMGSLRENRVQPRDLSIHCIRDALKALKLRKWYDQAHRITAIIEGVEPPSLTPEQEEKFKLMFMAAAYSFQKYCPESRTNFLSYSFCGRKIAEILGYTEFLPYFATLKGSEKLARADEIFKRICEDRNWPFIPSVAEPPSSKKRPRS